jgi:uncharacterized protein YdhG (YjbR/CyaY superfamily)
MKKPKTVAEYFASIPPKHRAALNILRKTIRALVPEATEVLSYGIPTFKLDRMLVAYAAFREHYSFFPLSSQLLDRYRRETARYRTSKGTLRFSFDEPLPVLLVKKIVKARVAENAS